MTYNRLILSGPDDVQFPRGELSQYNMHDEHKISYDHIFHWPLQISYLRKPLHRSTIHQKKACMVLVAEAGIRKQKIIYFETTKRRWHIPEKVQSGQVANGARVASLDLEDYL